MTDLPAPLATLTVDGTVLAVYDDGTGLDPALSPRPFLHPVRTLAGTVVSEQQPADHRWHLGVSVTLQDVGGLNFWGGRTYVRDQGYTWRDDHGRIVHDAWGDRHDDGFAQDLAWRGPDGRRVVDEHRTVRATRQPGRDEAWRLDFAFALRNATDAPLGLGSPATNGRTGAGYGGFFWRLPSSRRPVRVWTRDAEGEESVHGSVADWLAVSADSSDTTAPYTLVLAGADAATRADPWFVRVDDYPGVCSALAFAEPVHLDPGASVARHMSVVVADGILADDEVAALGGA